jgi:hypothetical protein
LVPRPTVRHRGGSTPTANSFRRRRRRHLLGRIRLDLGRRDPASQANNSGDDLSGTSVLSSAQGSQLLTQRRAKRGTIEPVLERPEEEGDLEES